MKLKLPLKTFFLIASLTALTGFHSQTPAAPQKIDHLDRLPVLHLDQQPDDKQTWGAIRWLMNGKIDADAGQSFGLVTINPGQQNTLHMHPNCEELFYVLSGSGDTVVADQKVTLHPGDLIRIPAHTVHQTTVTSEEPLVAVISYSSPAKQNVNYPGK
jgi:mannose-6-phosphate isomerase-like protein (cupin superfamily)